MNEIPLQILVIDDEARLSGQLRMLLEAQGYSVTTAVGGAAGIAALKASDSIDAVLTDVTMPDVDGYGVLQWVRENRPDTPVIVMTGYGSLESSTQALRLGAYDYILKPFSLPTVQAALGRASAAVARRRADEQRNAELAAVAAIARQMGRSLDPTSMADATLSAIVESTSAQGAMLFAVAETSMRWNLWRFQGLPEGMPQHMAELYPPAPLTKVTIIWEERPPWLAEAPHAMLQGWLANQGKVAYAAIPVEAGPNTQMALVLVGAGRATLAWSPPLLISLGNALSMALVNTRLFTAVREERDRLRLLYGISRELGTAIDPDELLSRIIQHTVKAVNADRGSIIIAPENGRPSQRLVVRYGMDQAIAEPVVESLLTSGLSGWVIKHRESARIADVQHDKRWLPITNTTTRVRSALAVPLIREEQVLGVMTLTHPRVDHFSVADLELVRSVSAQAAVAIENANLFAELEQRVFDLEALNATSRELTSALDPMSVARHVATRCAEMLDAPLVALLHVEADGRLWPLITLVDGKEQPLLTLGPVQAALNATEPLLLSNAGAQVEYLSGTEAPLGESWLAMPLVLGDAVDGVLVAAHTRANAFDAYERQLLTALAGQAVVAMESARLYATATEERTTLAAVIETVSDAILLVENGLIVVANPAAARIVNHTPDDLINQPLEQLYPMLPPIPRETTIINHEVAIDDQVLALNAAPLSANLGIAGQVIVLQDITHFKELDALKSRFVSMVSHDLKSPLTAIQGYAQMIANGHLGAISDPQKQALQAVIRNSQSMTMLISDLLDLGKIEAGIGINPQPCDLATLVREVVDELKIRAQMQNLSLSHEIPPKLPLIADQARIRQVLVNLVSNAIKYTPAGGEVRVQATNGQGAVHIEVRDSGLGIPPEALPHIFDRFYRVKRDAESSIEGTGLGLAIVKGIIDEHGGSIEVTSTVGQGSAFKVMLPLRAGARPAPAS